MKKQKIKVCYVPGYEADYARTEIFKRGMELNGLEVIDCSSKLKAPWRYFHAFVKFLAKKRRSDIILVGFLGQPLMPFVKLFTRKKILFDAFLSVYGTMVHDKKTAKSRSLKSKLYFWLDKYSCKLADKVFVDTQQHVEYFIRTFGIERKKMHRIFIGADETCFYPRKANMTKFNVVFHGRFIPLQGTKYIIQAANMLKGIPFIMIGNGQTFKEDVEFAKKIGADNITFPGYKRTKEIADYISKSGVCLGVFGDTKKTNYVIPNKVYEVIAMRKPIITSNTAGIQELFTDKLNACLCQRANAKAIANAILLLKNNKPMQKKIANNGYKLFKEKCSARVIGKELKGFIEKELENN